MFGRTNIRPVKNGLKWLARAKVGEYSAVVQVESLKLCATMLSLLQPQFISLQCIFVAVVLHLECDKQNNCSFWWQFHCCFPGQQGHHSMAWFKQF